jgi:hypothetical protein
MLHRGSELSLVNAIEHCPVPERIALSMEVSLGSRSALLCVEPARHLTIRSESCVVHDLSGQSPHGRGSDAIPSKILPSYIDLAYPSK